MKNSRLLVFEGANEVGKSTIAGLLFDALRKQRRPCDLFAFPGNEPGTVGHHIYRLHHHAADFGITRIDQTTLQLLHIAAHVDAITTRIIPALRRGRTVILDRFWWSTWVYGIVNGGNPQILKAALAVEHAAWQRVQPTRVFLVTRSTPLVPQSKTRDWNKIARTYRRLATQESRRVPVTLIANDSDVQVAFNNVVQALNL